MATQIAHSPAPVIEASVIAQEIATVGYSRLPDVFSPAELADAEAQIRAAIAEAGSRCCFPARAEVSGVILSDLFEAPWLRAIMETVYAQLTDMQPPVQAPTQTLRCLTGTDADQHAWYFHWDTWVVTAIVPILMPEDSQSGQLMLLPNARPMRRSYTRNVLDKMLIGTGRSQRRLRKQAARCTALSLEPGSLYLFSGYRTLHANATITPGDTRATLVLHFGDPYEPEERAAIDKARNIANSVRKWARRRR
jgi:hypothetical protein